MLRLLLFKSGKKTGLLSLFFLIFLLTSHAQEKQLSYSGHIRNPSGEALAGVSIREVGSPVIVLTDAKGDFTINVKSEKSKVEISQVGYTTVTLPISSSSNIVLIPKKSTLDEVVVVGYGTQSRRKVTGAISSLNGDEIKNLPEVSFDAMLQGRIAGLYVQSSSGEPGARTNIIIRGSTNVDYGNANGGNTQPLYVIDGVIYDVNNMQGSYALSNPLSVIDPNDIESIDVLKDASAAAIYGARGGNGVIIVKTRRTRVQRAMVSLSAYGGVTTRPALIGVTTGNAERLLKLQLLNSQLPYTDIANGNIPIQLTDSLNPAFNGDVDWQGMLIRKLAYVNNEDLSIAGAFDGKNNYRIALSHYNEQGAVKGYGVERIAPNLDLQLNPIPKLSIGVTLQMSQEKRKHGAGMNGNPYSFSTWSFPTSLAKLDPSTVALYDGSSNRFDDNNIFIYNTSMRLTDTLTKNLNISTTFGMNSYQDKYAYFSPVELNGVQNTAYNITSNNPNWTWETYAQYFKRFGDHNLTLVGGFSAYQAKQYFDFASAAGISVSGVYTIQTVPPGSNLNTYSVIQTKTTQSYYGRLNYDYKGKYLLTGSFRRDASSIYSASYRWATFYSVSAGWILSDELFFAPLKKVVNDFKVRASYGITGQDPGSWYAKYQQLYADASFLGATTGALGGTSANSYLTGTPSTYNGTTVVTPFPYYNSYSSNSYQSSSSVRWEKYPQLDIGADWSMFNNRISFVVDWYRKDAIDKYLWAVPAGSTTGYAYFSGNYANIRNQGLEMAVNTTNFGPKSAFQWNTSFNISFNKGWITKLPNGNRDIEFGPSWFRKTLTLGEPLFEYKSYTVKGVYATNADVPVDPITGYKMTYFGTPMQAGDRRIVDQNGDYNINYDDLVPTGSNAIPKVTGGFTNTFTYKGFSLSVFANYAYGNKLVNGTLSDALNGSVAYGSWGSVAGPAGVYSSILNQFWAKNGDQTTYPRLVYPNGTGTDPWNVNNSYFLQKGGYLRIQSINVAYNLPHPLVERLHLRNINVYGIAYNIHTFQQSKDLVDPALYDLTTGSSNSTYPLAVKFTFGFRVDL